MSRRLGLRLVPDREIDDAADGAGEAEPRRDDPPPDGHLAAPADTSGDQPPAFGATPAATPSR